MKKFKLVLLIIITIVLVAITGILIGLAIHGNLYNKNSKNPIVTLDISGYWEVQIELYPEYAPNTVLNFINLINKGYYNGKTFYGKDINAIYAAKNQEGEIVEPTLSLIDSSIETGSEVDMDYQINGEFIANGFDKNTLKHEKGVISMLRDEYSSYFGLTKEGYNSASSGFQIMLDTNRNLNGLYTGFGKVVEGLNIVEKIFEIEEKEVEENEENVSTGITELKTPAIIKNATVETFGISYEVPEVHQAFDYEAYLQNYFNAYSN